MSTMVSERWVTVARGLSHLIRSQADAVEANGTATSAVLEAIRGHDPVLARTAMHSHMEQASKRFNKSWDGR